MPIGLLIYSYALKLGFIVISITAAIYWKHRLVMYIFRKMLEDFNMEELMGESEGAATDSHPQTEVGPQVVVFIEVV